MEFRRWRKHIKTQSSDRKVGAFLCVKLRENEFMSSTEFSVKLHSSLLLCYNLFHFNLLRSIFPYKHWQMYAVFMLHPFAERFTIDQYFFNICYTMNE